ncbi:MAG: DUF998 domain-containing protein [Acidimicrobiia bacterium]
MLSPRLARIIALALLGTSFACVFLAPLAMPSGYSVLEHSISESAAQGLTNAWIARVGFVSFGLSVILLAATQAVRWSRWGQVAHGIFGVSMLAVAVFSHKPFANGPFDAFEDSLHSIGASVVGVAFIVGVLLVIVAGGPVSRSRRVFDWFAVAVALVAPPLMLVAPSLAGAFQRAMFGVAYLWYAVEAMTVTDRGVREARPGDAGSLRHL